MSEKETSQFAKYLKFARRILITSHISPDPDAVSSLLLLGNTLKENYPDKQVAMVLEEEPVSDLRFLEDYELLKFTPLTQALTDFEPDLFIIVDANNYERVSRKDSEQVRSYIAKKNNIKTIIIDHHELDGRENVDILINNKRPATAEEIYVLCFEELHLKKPSSYADEALLGIVSDTQRHRFDHPGYRETFRIVADLLDAGASVEKLESQLEHHNKNELEVISDLASNITNSGRGYTYSFISDEFLEDWQSQNKPDVDLKNAVDLFRSQFIRTFEGNKWGFIIYPELIAGPGWWGVSFRAYSGTRDVSAIARELGGGGHKPAAGARFQTPNVKEALQKVQEAIRQSKN